MFSFIDTTTSGPNATTPRAHVDASVWRHFKILPFNDHKQLQLKKQTLEGEQIPLDLVVQNGCITKNCYSCPSDATKTYFCILTTKADCLLSDVQYSLALTALILLSIPACHPRLTPDNPHCNTVPPYIKECMGNIASWNVSCTHCQPTQRQLRVLTKPPLPPNKNAVIVRSAQSLIDRFS